MKRVFCALLAALLLISLTGCGKKAKPPVTIDLEYFVRLGKIPECGLVLGASAAEFEREAQTFLKADRLFLEKEGVLYCCDEGDETRTVKYIVSYNGAYGFPAGTEVSIITEELAKGDMRAPELPLEQKELFWADEGEYTGIKYTYGVNTACFVFSEGKLYACAMY